ncbi:MAG: hypothetical protein IKG89_01840 [Oscillospiraceae bacterium]|nr:hypothetical protein [Oscillospiraceae bacterium]
MSSRSRQNDAAFRLSRCVFVVTHDLEAADTADLVLRMKDGVLTSE